MVDSTENVQHCSETATTEEHSPKSITIPDIVEQSGWSKRKKIALGTTLGVIALCLILGLGVGLGIDGNSIDGDTIEGESLLCDNYKCFI